MKKYFCLFFLTALISCKSKPDSNYDKFDPNKTYKLKLEPVPGSSYHYDIVNESETKAEINDKKIGKETRTELGIVFKLNKDSTGNLLLNVSYDKLRLHTKMGDTETNADAANAKTTLNPLERMLGVVKDANMVATLSPSGDAKSFTGYEELGNKIIATMDPNDVDGRKIAKEQWEKQMGSTLVKGNIAQLFRIFPDSAVHLNDEWQINSKQEGEVAVNMNSRFKLKAINNDVAIIAVEGTMTSDNSRTSNVMGMSNATANFQGKQEGEFQIETKTGMLINGSLKANMEGTISVMGREVPVTIKTSVKIDGRRL